MSRRLSHTISCFFRSSIRLIANNEICQKSCGFPTTKMNIKNGWKAGAVFLTIAVFFGMFWYLPVDMYIPGYVHISSIILALYYMRVRPMCTPGDLSARAAALISNYSRNHPVFLQLSDYFWVKNESKYALPYGTKGSEDLLMKFLALTYNYHMQPEIQRLSCRRCVVVGNGHRLKNSSLGETINKYDVVIRLNNAPVHRYKRDVGSKTSLRFFYPESADFDPQMDNNLDTLLVLVPFKPLDIQWMKIILNNEKRVRKGFWKMPPLIWEVEPQNTRILNPYYMEVTATKILDSVSDLSKKMKAKPTTGMLAITFALHFCDVVDIAGFGYPAPSDKKEPIHYYEKATLKSMAVSGHNITLEAIAIRNLLQHRLINNLTHY
ncbi:PREDICTED: CMP-N-acetylneuraminate-beta-galactosamide-alpha-2,3-sialyltransferase 4-like [Nanorana parkeri]|uniref:CMP-N-acetylneuraminate-beta-galactosamide- alpha-2,3-sialyltransferase 4-like n=1 Tax=Nanorana parkeri TaxID=125878 RepID=UPI0008549B6A|nr:PREDICTED: CMP-N-acetylneuraminate-beta-galactosamide-alpha-2,3-sialyltransferase 4-like [Nanorana parkeri]